MWLSIYIIPNTREQIKVVVVNGEVYSVSGMVYRHNICVNKALGTGKLINAQRLCVALK